MVLPDITDLLEARENHTVLYETLYPKADEVEREITRLEEEAVRRYKAANISEEECNHPVNKYLGRGESECSCCGKHW